MLHCRTALMIAVVLMASLVALAAAPPCSIHPPTGASKAELAKLSKVTEAEAKVAALKAIGSPKEAVVQSSELEVENGCLVWSFDIKVANKKGVEEVMVDAGNGQIISKTHESPKKENAEKKADLKEQPKK